MKKYELTSNFKMYMGRKLFQIRALVDLKIGVKAGELGGWIEKEKNLSHDGDAWVFDNAWVCGNAWVYGNAKVFDNAWVYGNAVVSGDAWVYGDAVVSGDAKVSGNAKVYGNAVVSGDAWVYGKADLLQITGLGTVHRTTTAYRTKNNGIKIVCGCFLGDLKEFRNQVVKTREGKVRDEYLKFAELIEIYFRL